MQKLMALQVAKSKRNYINFPRPRKGVWRPVLWPVTEANSCRLSRRLSEVVLSRGPTSICLSRSTC